MIFLRDRNTYRLPLGQRIVKKSNKLIRKAIKRAFDIIVSLTGLIVLSPLLLLIAFLVAVTSPGGAIFKQERLGLNGKPFWMYKFRSMRQNSEHTGSGVYSSKGDPRVTWIGKIIRATSLDELPQFVNILKGDMSLIGPRPVLTYHPWPFEQYDEFQRRRFDMRPGVTGYAQTHGRKQIEWQKRIEYDVRYVDDFSLWLDVKIFFLTIWKIVAMSDNTN